VGKLKSPTAWFIADANVLIDYVKTNPQILGLVSKHVGPVYVVADVLEEVEQLDAEQCHAIGLTIVEGTLAQITEASQRGGPLSFEDKLCLILARDNGWACLSNDGPLRDACKAQGVSVVWGLEIMLQLVDAGHVSAALVIEVAESIHSFNQSALHHPENSDPISPKGSTERQKELKNSAAVANEHQSLLTALESEFETSRLPTNNLRSVTASIGLLPKPPEHYGETRLMDVS
jgi:predicted nucleic acid-binding protein